jgi:tetratricopeptide (TPR) repeat protein
VRRGTVLPLFALGVATLLSARTGLAQAEFRATDAQRVTQYKGAAVAFEKALGYMDKKDRDGALDSLNTCFEQMPDFPEGHFLKARILYSEKEFTQALPEIVKAEAGHESTADLRETMYKDRQRALQDRIKKKDDAIRDQKTLAASLPMEQRQKVYDKINQMEGEKEILVREVMEFSKGPVPIPARYSTLHGNILLRLDKLPEATTQYEAALKVDPAYGEAANNLASIYHMSGQNEKAMEIVTEARKRGAKLHPELAKSIEAALAKKP